MHLVFVDSRSYAVLGRLDQALASKEDCSNQGPPDFDTPSGDDPTYGREARTRTPGRRIRPTQPASRFWLALCAYRQNARQVLAMFGSCTHAARTIPMRKAAATGAAGARRQILLRVPTHIRRDCGGSMSSIYPSLSLSLSL